MTSKAAIDEDTLADWKEAFDAFDVKSNGIVSLENLRHVMLLLGRDMNPQELSAMCNNSTVISWQQFQNQMAIKSSTSINYNELVESMRALSKTGAATVEAAELRYSMTNMGEKLEDDEMNLMLLEADPDGTGTVNVESLAKLMSSA